jgi:hypothetical protein
MKIKDIITKREEAVGHKILKANPHFAPTHNKLLELIDSYWNSKFRDNPLDSRGFRKPFFNVVRVPTFVSAKATDLDTKNIKIISSEGQSMYKSYIFGKELKFYFKEHGFDLLLNQITYNRPKYGEIVLKKAKGVIYIVPTANILPSPDVEVMNTPIVEKHEMTFDEIKEMPWDNIKKAIAIYEKADKEKCQVYEITGKCDDDSFNYRIITGLDCGLETPIYLVGQNIDNPYRKLKWEDVPGRALGRGTVEEQFESQIAVNENEYLFRLGLQWTSKHLFWSKDLQVAKNLLSEALNGEVLGSEIMPIAMEERNLNSFQYADNKWQQHSDVQSFSSPMLQGSAPAGRGTATTASLEIQQAQGYYNLKRQDAGIFLKSVIEDWILPDFAREKGKAHDIHIMKLLGDDNASQKLFNATLAQEVNKKVIEFMGKGKMLSGNELQLVKSMTAAGLKGKDFSLPADFYDFDYSVDVVITGEQIDMAQRATALQTAFQVIGSNPTILQDPVVRRTYFKLLEMTGVNPMELFDEDVPDLTQTMQNIAPAQVGGSIARPQPTMPATQQVPTAV